MPETPLAPDETPNNVVPLHGPETLAGLKIRVRTRLQELQGVTNFQPNPNCTADIGKSGETTFVTVSFTNPALGGCVYFIGPDGTIADYQVLPPNPHVGTFRISENLYKTLLSILGSS